MQAKIIDYASGKIAKSLQKIDKDDVVKAYSKVSSKVRRNKYLIKKDEKVTNTEEKWEMLEISENDSKSDKNVKIDKQLETLIKVKSDDDSHIEGEWFLL